MTNEEIISSLRGLIGKYNLTDEEWQTVEKTIEVLSNSDEDCISKKAVLSLPRKQHSFIYSEDYESIDVKLIEDLPSIQPKRPKGNWDFTKEGRFFCPYCKKFPKDQSCTTDFCPTCGAKMESEDKE